MSKLYYILNEPPDKKPPRSAKLNKAANQYLRETKSFLYCGPLRRHKLIAEVRGMLIQYYQENPSAQLENLFEAFGTPEEFANTLYPPSRAQKLGHQNRIRLCMLLLCVCLVLAGARVLMLQHQQEQSIADSAGSGSEVSVRTYDYKTKQDVDQFPLMIRNVIKYDLNYTFDADGNIESAYDSDGNKIPVDSSGNPLGPDYPLSQEYRDLPDR